MNNKNGQFVDVNNLLSNKKNTPRFALFEYAFRPFFLFATTFAVIHIVLWVHLYQGKLQLAIPANLLPTLWHAHEMIFGYGLAVIIGFLLTAVTNWTNLKTMIRKPLMLTVGLWLIARIVYLTPIPYALAIAAICDLLVAIIFVVDFSRPVIKSKNKRQIGFVAKLLLFFVANLLFYLGVYGVLANGASQGVYLGFYLIMSVIFVLGRRVIPFFIQRGVGYQVELANPKWIDVSSLLLFTVFTFWDVFFSANIGLAILSFALFLLQGLRLFNWYTKGIWKFPLLWVLWTAYGLFVIGFLLKSLSIFGWVSPYLALHTFAYGGVGLMTVGMMARVCLGHTGRNVFAPSKWVNVIFWFIIIGTLFRVVLPIILPNQYILFLNISAILWCLAFTLFIAIYAKILITRRADGKAG